MKPRYDILTKRRFFPLFITQFLGAMNDNIMRNGLVTLITYKIVSAVTLGADPKILVTAAAVLLVAPYIFFSGIAGELSDKYERSKLMRFTKFWELGVMLLAAYGFWTNDVYLLLGLLFFAGTQATFFSPMKYSVLPDHLNKDELITGNGFIEGGTYVAILVGTILGVQFGKLVDLNNPTTSLYVIFAILTVAILGIISVFFIPPAVAAAPKLKINPNPLSSTWDIMKMVHGNKPIFYSIMGTSWFWLIGLVFLSEFPAFGRDVLYTSPDVYTIFLVVFSLGVAIGAVTCAKVLKGQVTGKYAHYALFGITFFTLFMVAAAHYVQLPPTNIYLTDKLLHDGALTGDAATKAMAMINQYLLPPEQFFSRLPNVLVLIGVFGISFCGGFYTVPLKAIIQTRSSAATRSRMVAGDNIFNAIFMVGAGIVTAVLIKLGMGVIQLFLLVAAVNLLYAFFIKSIVRKIV